jgi:DNA-binding CsgD family transcriptional regulator
MFVSEAREQIKALQSEGVPTLRIAQRLGVAEATVHYHLRKLAEGTPMARPAGEIVRPTVHREKTRERVAGLLDQGLSRIEIARRLRVSKATVSYHARRLGAPIDERCRRRYDWHAIQRYYDVGYSVRECARAFGFATSSWGDAVKRGDVVARPRARPAETMFAANTHRNRAGLKRRLITEGFKTGCCEVCGIDEWLGRPLTMTLHHVNGDRLDNRVENLQLLCANCHSQTSTFGGRNLRRPAG